MGDTKIFRKQALDTVVIGILAIIIGVFVWAVTGTITTSENIRGVLFPANSVKIASSIAGGKVTDVLVDEGETVEKGDVLAVVPDVSFLGQIKELRKKYESSSGAEKEQVGSYLELAINEYVDRSFIKANKSGSINKVVSLKSDVEPGGQVAISIINEESSNSKEILAYVPGC